MYISQVHENHSNNLVKLIVHLLISFGSDFLFSFGDKKNKKLIFLRGLSVIILALGAVCNGKLSQPGIFSSLRKRRHKKTAYLAHDSPHFNLLTHKKKNLSQN